MYNSKTSLDTRISYGNIINNYMLNNHPNTRRSNFNINDVLIESDSTTISPHDTVLTQIYLLLFESNLSRKLKLQNIAKIALNYLSNYQVIDR